jgi:DNA anti-recombination protein RmuC
MEDTIVRLIEQLPLSVGVLLIMFWLGRRFLSIWEVQVSSRDAFLNKLLDRFSTMDQDASDIKTSVIDLAKQMVVLQTSTDEFAKNMVSAFTNMDSVVKGWRDSNAIVIQTIQTLQTEQTSEISALRAEVSTKMGKLEENNHDIYNQLEAMGARLNQLIGILEAANLEDFASVPGTINALLAEIKSAVERVAVQRQEEQTQRDENMDTES